MQKKTKKESSSEKKNLVLEDCINETKGTCNSFYRVCPCLLQFEKQSDGNSHHVTVHYTCMVDERRHTSSTNSGDSDKS